jgi:hypothetical protein
LAGAADRMVKHNEVFDLRNFLEFHKRLSHPIYVITFKDIFSIANRNRISMNSHLVTNMENVLRIYRRILTLAKSDNTVCYLDVVTKDGIRGWARSADAERVAEVVFSIEERDEGRWLSRRPAQSSETALERQTR